MTARWLLVIILITAVGLSGCEYGKQYVSKPWGKWTWIPAAACGVVGGGVGAAIESQRGGHSCTTVNGVQQCVSDDPNYAPAVAIGAVSGAVLCGLLGHLADPGPPTPPPPPPPPTPPPPPPPSSKRIVLRGVNFDFNKSDILPDSRPILDQAAEVLRDEPNIRIVVEGYTDSIGSDEYNDKLSVRRAEAVFRYLVNKGVAPERMEVIGYGKSRPVADNDTASGRAQNRRVELHIVEQQ